MDTELILERLEFGVRKGFVGIMETNGVATTSEFSYQTRGCNALSLQSHGDDNVVKRSPRYSGKGRA